MRTTDSQLTTATKLERITWLSARGRDKEFNGLMHHFNEESLKECFNPIAANKAVGIDGVTKEEYGQHLDENLQGLVGRMKQMAYRPASVRQVLIPKVGRERASIGL